MKQKGDTFEDRRGETWRVKAVKRRHVEAEHLQATINPGEPSGIVARFPRNAVERNQ